MLSMSVLAADLPPAAVAVWEELDAVTTMRAQFTQTQIRLLLADPLVSSGTVSFQRPGRVRWQVDQPIRSIFVLDGTTVTTAIPDLNHRDTVELGSNPEAARLVQGLMVWLGGDLEAVQRDYEVQWTEGTPHHVILTPRQPALAALMRQIDLNISNSPSRVEQVWWTEPSGDTVSVVLTETSRNTTLPKATFELP